MHNLYTKFVKILEICKQFSNKFVNEQGNIPRRGPVPKFSDLEVVALSLVAESESIDSGNRLFESKFKEYKGKIPNLISRRQFNDRRKSAAGLCEKIRRQIAMAIDGRSVIREYGNPPNNRKRSAHGSATIRNTCSPLMKSNIAIHSMRLAKLQKVVMIGRLIENEVESQCKAHLLFVGL